MYDVKSEPAEFVADSRDEAVALACRFFDTESSELKIAEPEPNEIYGLGARVVVVAVPRGAQRPRPERGGDEKRSRGRRERPERGERGERRGGRGEREDRGRERGDRDRGDRDRGGRDRGRDRDDDAGPAEEPIAAKSAPTKEASKGTPRGDLGEIGLFVQGAVERMVVGGFEISESAEGDFLIVQITGDAAEELGSGDGRAVDALQLLANQAAMRMDDEAPRVVVDAEGNAERREAFLTRLAERAARRASDTRRSVALDPMNAKDRRMIHVAVRDLDGVATMSIGSGRYRQVVVVPEGADEYEEAVKSSESASGGRD